MNIRRLRTLIAALKDPQTSLVWNAARELASLGRGAEEALPSLQTLLTHPDPNTVLWARFAIAKITDRVETHLPFFVEALRQRTLYYPGMAETAVAGFGDKAAVALPLLIERLTDANADTRWSSAWAIGAMAPLAASAVPDLTRMLKQDPDEKVRWYAAFALSEMQGEALGPIVEDLMETVERDFDDDVRGYAIRALGKTENALALPLLERLLQEENPLLKQEAEGALRRFTSAFPRPAAENRTISAEL